MKFFKIFDALFWSRLLFVGIGMGLFMIYVIDNMFGKGWIAGYTLCILFSKIGEFVKQEKEE